MSTMLNAQTVYYGPSTASYPSVGSVSSGETVSALWQENAFVFIEYSITGTTQKKRGYILKTDPSVGIANITITESVSTKNFTSVAKTVTVNAPTYIGPSTNSSLYPSAGSVSSGETVYALTTDGDFTFIEYSVTGTSQKKRAYVSTQVAFGGTSSGGTGSTLVIGQRPSDMNLSSAHYTSSNIYYNAGYSGECTWFCWGRAHEKRNKSIYFNGTNNGGEWYAHCNYSASGVTQRAANLGPVSNSICSCSGLSSAGHVIFVEAVSGDVVYYTEAHITGFIDGVVKSCLKSDFPPQRTAYGYIVL